MCSVIDVGGRSYRDREGGRSARIAETRGASGAVDASAWRVCDLSTRPDACCGFAQARRALGLSSGVSEIRYAVGAVDAFCVSMRSGAIYGIEQAALGLGGKLLDRY